MLHDWRKPALSDKVGQILLACLDGPALVLFWIVCIGLSRGAAFAVYLLAHTSAHPDTGHPGRVCPSKTAAVLVDSRSMFQFPWLRPPPRPPLAASPESDGVPDEEPPAPMASRRGARAGNKRAGRAHRTRMPATCAARLGARACSAQAWRSPCQATLALVLSLNTLCACTAPVRLQRAGAWTHR